MQDDAGACGGHGAAMMLVAANQSGPLADAGSLVPMVAAQFPVVAAACTGVQEEGCFAGVASFAAGLGHVLLHAKMPG
jgi:hypothetical protein